MKITQRFPAPNKSLPVFCLKSNKMKTNKDYYLSLLLFWQLCFIACKEVEVKSPVVQIDSIPTLKTSAADIGVVVEDEDKLVAIRRLTPRECFRLMGWSSYDFMRLEGKISETGLYRLAGNSVVVSVLKAMFRALFGVHDEE